jgi:hypothetical protein
MHSEGAGFFETGRRRFAGASSFAFFSHFDCSLILERRKIGAPAELVARIDVPYSEMRAAPSRN